MLVKLESDRTLPVKECLLLGYEASLKRFHGLVGRTTFGVAARAAPERKSLVANLGPREEVVFARLRALLPEMLQVLDVNEAFLVDKGIEDPTPGRLWLSHGSAAARYTYTIQL